MQRLSGLDASFLYLETAQSRGSGLNVTVISLNGKLDVGLVSCPELLPDLWDLADDFAVGLEELRAAKP